MNAGSRARGPEGAGGLGLEEIGGRALEVSFSGTWTRGAEVPPLEDALRRVRAAGHLRRVVFRDAGLSAWDSRLLAFVLRLVEAAEGRGAAADTSGLPAGVRRLLGMASAPPGGGGRAAPAGRPLLEAAGESALLLMDRFLSFLEFTGEALAAFLRMVTGRGRFRRADLIRALGEAGAGALPIVCLIGLLLGLILAFVGAVQLRAFGAEVYVADLVGVAMVRYMGAVMTGIVMAGRTGAAYAAELGAMQVNEETDALTTLGIPPMEFLVIPRIVALTVMMPLLCLYADLMGLAGGLVVGAGVLGINPGEYMGRTRAALGLHDLMVGLFMAVVFGVIVSVAGCMKGMGCGRTSAAVGRAATSAVVISIVGIIASTALITMLAEVLGL